MPLHPTQGFTNLSPKTPRNPVPNKAKPILNSTKQLPLEFGRDHKAHWLYLNLKLKGVKDQAMDLGCPTLDFSQAGKVAKNHPGKPNGSLSACEIFEYTLSHYEKFPKLARILSDGPLPWSIDDFDATTTWDQNLLKWLKGEYLQTIKDQLAKLNLDPQSPPYQERLALALMTAIHLPPKWYPYEKIVKESPHLLDQPSHLKAIHSLEQEFHRLGMTETWKYLRKIGGIVPIYLTGPERSALQAIKDAAGKCTENSKVLFALYRMVGLEPYFVYIEPNLSSDPAIKNQAQIDPHYDHVAVGLKIKGQARIYDPTLYKFNTPIGEGLPLSLRQYLAMDFSNHANAETSPERQKEFIDRGLALGVEFPLLYQSQSNTWMFLKEPKRALAAAKKVAQLAPGDGLGWYQLSAIYADLGDNSKALNYIEKAIRAYPKFANAFYVRAIIKLKLDQIDEARRDFVTALQLKVQGVEGGSDMAKGIFHYLNNYWAKNLPNMNLPKNFSKELDISQVSNFFAHLDLAKILMDSGHREPSHQILQIIFKKVDMTKQRLAKSNKSLSPSVQKTLIIYLKPFENDPEIRPLLEKHDLLDKP